MSRFDKRTDRLEQQAAAAVAREDTVEIPHEPILQFFEWEKLDAHDGSITRPFAELAQSIVTGIGRSPERTVALRHLLDALEAVRRAARYRHT